MRPPKLPPTKQPTTPSLPRCRCPLRLSRLVCLACLAEVFQALHGLSRVVKGRHGAALPERWVHGKHNAVGRGVEHGDGEHEVPAGGLRAQADARHEGQEGRAAHERVQEPEVRAHGHLTRGMRAKATAAEAAASATVAHE